MAYTTTQKAEYKQAQQEKQRELLASALDRLTTSEGWRQYLDSRAKFHKYSFSNTILVALQRPDATDVAGAKKWKTAFKRAVLDAEFARPIFILAPLMVPVKVDGVIQKDENGKARMKVVFYKTVKVYDVTQTEGDPLPQPVVFDIEGDSHEETLLRLEQWAGMGSHNRTSKPINRQVYDLTGYLIRWGMDNKLENFSSTEAEVIAEAATYLACRQMGLDTSGVTIPHIAQWDAKDEKTRMNMVREFAKAIDILSDEVLEAVKL